MSDLPPPSGSEARPDDPPGTAPPPPPTALNPPPGYMAYESSPTPIGQVSRVGGVAKAAMVLAGLTIPVVLLSLPASISIADKASDFLNGDISRREFEDAYGPFALVLLLQQAITLAAGILAVIWMYRMAANVRTFGRATTWAPIWAVFSWVLPPFLYVIPLLMLREIWKASDPSVAPGDQTWRRGAEQPLLWVWFAVYAIVPLILAIIQFNTLFGGGFGGDIEDAADAVDEFGAIGYISVAISVVAAIVWIMVIRALTARHVRLIGER